MFRNFIAFYAFFSFLCFTRHLTYVYKGQIHSGEKIPEFNGEKTYVYMEGSYSGLELPKLYGYAGNCFNENRIIFMPIDISIYTTFKSWCLTNINSIKNLFEKYDIDVFEFEEKVFISNQNSQLNLKWIQLVEELLSSSDQKELIK